MNFFGFFRQSDPPRKSQNAKMRNFCNGFYKMMMSTLKKITESQIWGNYFIVKNIGLLHNMLPSPWCVTRPQWVNWTLGNKLQWNLNRNSCIFIQENAFENVVWKMAAILSRPPCVKSEQAYKYFDISYRCNWRHNFKTQWHSYCEMNLVLSYQNM